MSTLYRGIVEDDQDWKITKDFIESDPTPLDPRFDLVKHSPDGFSWGYAGSGPAQSALAILADHLDSDDEAMAMYQDFNRAVIAAFDMDEGWTLTSEQVAEWVQDWKINNEKEAATQ